jgi:cell division protein ZapA (FtsZ GTPase activity inhibitor)
MSHTYDTLPINTDEERVGALNCAARMLDDAVAWLNENDLKHERKGRNQDRLYFLRAVFAQLYPDEVMKLDRKRGKRVSWLTNRMKRFGGKKIDLMVAQRLNY